MIKSVQAQHMGLVNLTLKYINLPHNNIKLSVNKDLKLKNVLKGLTKHRFIKFENEMIK